MKLLVVLPLTAADLPLTASLLRHLATLGPQPNNPLLFVADAALTKAQYDPLMNAAKPLFPVGGELISTPVTLPNNAYPYGHNFRFETATRHIAARVKRPFLFLDPRCVPMRRTWLHELEAEYFKARRPFMGQVLRPETHGTSQPLMLASGIYPAEVPKRMLQLLIARRGTDFERTCAELVVPQAHPTRLIYSLPPGTAAASAVIPAGTAMVHAAEALALHRGRPKDAPAPPSDNANKVQGTGTSEAALAAPRAEVVDAPSEPKATPTPPPPRETAYYHSGNLGDVIYALAAIRLAGGGRLLLGPRQRKTPACDKPILEPAFQALAPLLAQQPYLTRCAFAPRHPGTDRAFDLNRFRLAWHDPVLRARIRLNTLVGVHCHTLGVLEKFRHEDTWLRVDAPTLTPYFTVHRSARYRTEGDAAFPWASVVKRLQGRLLFVGLPQEHNNFQRTWNVRLPFWHCADFLDLARIIAGSRGFIGNQSFPMALALGLGQRVLQETWPTSPDCVFARPGSFVGSPFTEAQLEAWVEGAPPL